MLWTDGDNAAGFEQQARSSGRLLDKPLVHSDRSLRIALISVKVPSAEGNNLMLEAARDNVL